ncbi:CBO0543 family protein [Neobacillus mesonae]|uniref:CBO0543 family protein n=1 Tax=Neobacillus mesonae TaxID=1193713 RepID=UPI0024680134|nr:CBO0543 family protein [Neobacillus mesonae]
MWLCDMPAFKYGLFSAPVRELPKATDLPLTIDYFFYPVWFAIFYVHKRIQANLWSRMTYFFVWVSVITIFDIVLERYTDLIEYETVAWYGIWIYFMILFFVSQVCCDWFFKDQTLFQAELEQANEN